MNAGSVLIALAVATFGATGANAQTSRLLEELNWIEVGQLVPDSTQTVLLPAGILEAHGVINNGADITAPVELSARLAPRVNALIAPVIPYGVQGSLGEYPGTFGIRAETYEEYAYETMRGLAANGFINIVVVNGHGPNGTPLRAAAQRVWEETESRVLVLEWWSMTADLVASIYGSSGGHAGNNETGAILAVRPDLVHSEWYSGEAMTTPRGVGWSAFPFPSTILLYEAGEGYPDFDPEKARRYFDGVVDRMATVITDVLQKWDRGGR